MTVQVQFVARRRAPRRGLHLVVALVVLLLAGVVAAYSGGVTAAQDPAIADAPTAPLTPTPAVPSPPAASPAPVASPAAPPLPAGRAALVAQLEGLLAAPGIEGALAVAVTDEHGRVLVERAGDQPLLPASTQKLVTAAAALEVLGPDHRFRTVLMASRQPDAVGVLHGDLVLRGAGDPALASPRYGREVYPARPRTPMEALADAVAARGITHVTGSVVGEARAWPTQPDARGWFPRYFWDLDARHVSSLTAEAGLDLTVDPETGELTIGLAPDPVLTAARALQELLAERGVTVSRPPRVAGADDRAPYRVGQVDSPPLADLLRHTVQRSDNHMADTLLLALATEVTGSASWARGARAAQEALAAHGLDWTGVVIADGSGLSRDNRLTARLLAGLDRAMHDSAHADVWASLMAVAGDSGTLRQRLTGTPAEGALAGKTGTLDDVRAIAGVVTLGDARRYHLAVVANDLAVYDSRINTRVLQDNLALALASDLRGCRETTPAHDPEVEPSPPPRSWDCAWADRAAG